MRDRKLQRAIDTINLYGGLAGAAEIAASLGVKVENLNKRANPIKPVARISRGRIPVYLAADVEPEKKRRA